LPTARRGASNELSRRSVLVVAVIEVAQGLQWPGGDPRTPLLTGSRRNDQPTALRVALGDSDVCNLPDL
jgi:hypothetical protein